MKLVISITLAVLLVATPALAQPSQEVQAQVERLYEAGTQHYNLGEYEEAIASYKDAYRLIPNPYLLYNIAQSYRLADDSKQALAFYKRFLYAKPDAPERPDVDARIKELELIVAQQAATQAAAPSGPVAPTETPRLTLPPQPVAEPSPITVAPIVAATEPSRPVYKKWWFWAGIGVVAAGASTVALMSGGDSPPSSDLGNFPVF